MPREEVKNVIAQTLSANFRAIVGQLTVEDVHRDRDAFVNRVQELASDEMAAMGVRLISMGIEEITDDQGYFEAMAKPVIANVKRDATIAEAEADREARNKAANARREAEQTELEAARAFLEQKEALDLREVQKGRTVGLAEAESEEAVQHRRAAAVAEHQEAEILVPARAQREAREIQADAERRKLTIAAEARAQATRTEASASAEATKVTDRADAEKFKALRLAEAEATRANLLAEAEGKAQLAQATAAEREINLRQVIAELMIQAEIEKVEAIGRALQGVGENVRVVQFSGSNGTGSQRNALVDLLLGLPEVAALVNAKTEALSGENLEGVLNRVRRLLGGSDGVSNGEASGGDTQEAPANKTEERAEE